MCFLVSAFPGVKSPQELFVGELAYTGCKQAVAEKRKTINCGQFARGVAKEDCLQFLSCMPPSFVDGCAFFQMMFIEEASVGQRTLNHSFDWGKVIWGVIIVTKRVLLTTTTLMVAGHQSCRWGKVGFLWGKI